MLRLRSATIALLGVTALAACNKTGSPPGGFGVNVTVDARALTAAHVAAARKGSLIVVIDGAAQPAKTFDVQGAIGARELRFHYTPPASAAAGDALTLGFDLLDAGDAVIASGSTAAPVTLKATSVDVKITLEDGAPTTDGGAGKANGTACVVDTECSSGICAADGVCCDKECDGVCESCKLAASKGTCTPIADGEDPDLECGAKLPPMPAQPDDDDGGAATADAGGDAADAGDAAGDAASPDAADAGAAEAAASDAAVINTPDGGLMSMPGACAGTCNGARACKYPGKTTSCGKPFCNTAKEVAAFACDGNGGCNIELSPCADYACDPDKGSCKTLCGGNGDCLSNGKYCNGTSNMCAPKKDNGITCANGDECSSGNCISNVCCNTACDGAGLSCATGKCVCPGVTCAAGVACQVFFQDSDGDTFGNRAGTLAGGTAKAGCAGTPPAGFVADATDCDDGDANVHPGQTDYFGVPSKGIGTFDYNCDKAETKETPEFPGGSCKFCGAVGSCDKTTTTCTSANQSSSFACPQEIPEFSRLTAPLPMSLDLGLGRDVGAAALLPNGAAAAPPGEIVDPVKPPVCQVCVLQCCGCHAADKTGYLATVKCGASAATYTCGACAAVGGAAPRTTNAAKVQRCR